MGKYKLKPILQEQVIRERKKKEEQSALRKKYGISEKKFVEVRKEHLLTSVFKILHMLFSKTALLILIILAFAGAVSILHPASREALIYILREAVKQLQELWPDLAPVVEKLGAAV